MRNKLSYSLVALWMVVIACDRSSQTASPGNSAGVPVDELLIPSFDRSFWEYWGDGAAELAGYDLTFPRYGHLRNGVAVTIFVTETFSESLRVKADPGRHPESDTFPVMKLNLVEDYQTGIYDYNDMMSGFVALEAVTGRPAGSLTKVSFSSQEWCGHVYQQVLMDADSIHYQLHSYFDGEADQESELNYPAGAVTGDALHHWARGMAYPALDPGESVTLPYLPTLRSSRHAHEPLQWGEVTLFRSENSENIEVPAGKFEVDVWTASVKDGIERRFYVEKDQPRRIIRWQSSEGEVAEMLASDRVKYWQMNGPEGHQALERLGLKGRPSRTP